MGVVGFEPDGVMDVEPRVRPGEHGLGVVVGEELMPDEGAQQSAPESFGEELDLVEAEMDEGAVGPEDAIGDDEVQVRVPVQECAEGLDGGDRALVSKAPRGRREPPPQHSASAWQRHTTPWSIMLLATLMKPAMFAPTT